MTARAEEGNLRKFRKLKKTTGKKKIVEEFLQHMLKLLGPDRLAGGQKSSTFHY